jgi:transcriptional regulator with XRE-family HTH domain
MTKPTEAGRRAAGRAALARRGELGLTQAEVAERAGVDVQTYRTLETGERWPIAKNLAPIGMALGFRPGELTAIADGETERVA